MNGLMIDMARLIEKKAYYYQLIDFMHEWAMDTLQVHFSDNHGMSIKLNSFEIIAAKHAFTEEEIRNLIDYAESKGIELIPELEVFGHTKFLTDNPLYHHLDLGKQDDAGLFSAIDPLSSETELLMKTLIKKVGDLFDSKYFHIGCDEVCLDRYCREKNLDKDITWVNYVNKMIGITRDLGKQPMMWADHPVNNKIIAQKLRKDVILDYWSYLACVYREGFFQLVQYGFKEIILSPSLASCLNRFFPPQTAFDNLKSIIALNEGYSVKGLINTLWCPWRYLQKALYYGIARSAEMVRLKREFHLDEFNEKFASRFFHEDNNRSLQEFLKYWPEAGIEGWVAEKLGNEKKELTQEEVSLLKKVNDTALNLMKIASHIRVSHRGDVWRSFVLSVKCAWLCSEALLVTQGVHAKEVNKYKEILDTVLNEFKADWNQGRFPEDLFYRHPGEKRNQYAFFILQDLPGNLSEL